MIEKISERELHMIDYLRHSAIERDNESDFFTGKFCPTNSWLYYWERAKEWMAPVFKDGLILKKKIFSTIPDNELYYSLQDNVLNTVYGNIVKKNIIKYIFENSNYKQVIDRYNSFNRTHIEAYIESDFFTSGNLAENTYNNDDFEISGLPNGKVLKVVHGCKLMKILGKIAQLADCAQEFEEFRLAHSRIMNQASLQSNLCISIHPLDFMTASVNENDWRSCMHWEDGEYRRGVIEMMNSPCVVVAYLESGHERLSIGPEAWNSKKWREFFIVDKNFISGIKGYPYWNRDIEKTTLLWLKELFAPLSEKEYSDKVVTWQFGHFIYDEGANSVCEIEFDCGPAMYNDFYGDNEYQTILAKNFSEKSYCNYSGASICVCCGEENNFDSEGVLCCNDCVEKYYCCICGDLIYRERDLINHDGRCYCSYCYENLPTCDFCEEVVDPDNDTDAFEFYVGPNTIKKYNTYDYYSIEDNIQPSAERGFLACGCCAPKIFRKSFDELYSRHTTVRRFYHRTPLIPIEEITDFGKTTIDEETIKDIELAETEDYLKF